MHDRVINAAVRLTTGSHDWTTERFTRSVERVLDEGLVAAAHGAQGAAESRFGSIDAGHVKSVLDCFPVADEEGRLDVVRREHAFPVDFVTSTRKEPQDVGPHRVCRQSRHQLQHAIQKEQELTKAYHSDRGCEGIARVRRDSPDRRAFVEA